MSVWYAIPSIRENGGTIPLWKKQGYRIAVLRQGPPISDCDMQIPTGEYLGWAPSVNLLSKMILNSDHEAQWIVTGGDDYEPDQTYCAEEIGEQCSFYFASDGADKIWRTIASKTFGTFGIMQPTGDRWGDTEQSRRQYGDTRGAYIDRIAGSPWMGRQWCELAYGGHGPMFFGYHHLYADEELFEVATKLGVYWPRKDLVQKHNHWGRKPGDEFASLADCPDFLLPINTPQSWNSHRELFITRKSSGWPGHEPK